MSCWTNFYTELNLTKLTENNRAFSTVEEGSGSLHNSSGDWLQVEEDPDILSTSTQSNLN